MRLHLLLPSVEPSKIAVPSTCPVVGCQGKRFRLHQPVQKALRDTVHQHVEAHRYECLKCRRTFRVYPHGVSAAQISKPGERLSRDALLAGLELWRGVLSLASSWRLHEQDP